MKALPAQWRNVEHLPGGFPTDFRPPLAAAASDCKGDRIDLGRAPTVEELADLLAPAKQGYLLDY